jgi:hypothetical protein
MNKRIEELAEQAGIHPYNFEPDADDPLKKFAELIVRECASIVYNTCNDGDIGAQAILYEFDIDGARSQK